MPQVVTVTGFREFPLEYQTCTLKRRVILSVIYKEILAA